MTDYISQMPVGLDRAILRVLSFHKGVNNSIPRKKLIISLLNHGFDLRRDDRPMRACINRLRKQGEPICSSGGDNGGYYRAANRAELDDYIQREVQSKINDYAEQIKAMRNAFPPDNQLRMI